VSQSPLRAKTKTLQKKQRVFLQNAPQVPNVVPGIDVQQIVAFEIHVQTVRRQAAPQVGAVVQKLVLLLEHGARVLEMIPPAEPPL
jgi:hypothetical protein